MATSLQRPELCCCSATAEGKSCIQIKDQPPVTESSYRPDTTQDTYVNIRATVGSHGSVQSIPMNRPHSGGNTSERAEGGLNLQVLHNTCTLLSQQVLNLQKAKDAQAIEILKLKTRIKKLEKKCKPNISHHRAWLRCDNHDLSRYLKGKPKLDLWYPRVLPFDLEANSDSDYAGANLDRKSTTGGCQFLDRRLISWQCKKQTIMATSTTEAEYVAAANCCGQLLWIQNQMLDYGFNFMNTKIYIDNESTICIVKNPVFHSKTKHIEIRNHFIRDAYEKKLIQVLKIHTDDNVADLLTKAFDVSRFSFLLVNIGMINL
ncbi:hypothetical protein Tco_0455728 [Tanacetum coccineum]